jgi:CHASE3 domain sensor protein
MSTFFTVWACVAVGLIELALAALGYVSYRNSGKLGATAEGVARGHTVIEQTDLVEDLLDRAEASECKYLLTGDRNQLEAYRTTLARLDAALGTLDTLTHDEPDERQQVEALAAPLGRKRQLMDEEVRLRGEGNIQAALALLGKDSAPEEGDEVGRATAGLRKAEREMLGRRQAEAAITLSETRGTIVVGHGLLLVVLSLGGVALYGEARGRRLGEERYRRLVELCPDAILIVRGGRVVFANGAAFKLLGTTSEQLVGQSPYSLVHADSQSAVRARLEEVVATGRP